MIIYLLIGLPGSGKTHFGNKMRMPFLDDLSQNGGLQTLKDKHFKESFVISDYALVKESTRQIAENVLRTMYPTALIDYIVWENSPEKCWKNIKRRKDGRKISESFLYMLSNEYTYPKGVKASEILSVFID